MAAPYAPNTPQRVELHSGLSGGTKGVLGCLLIGCIVFLVPVLAGLVGALLFGVFNAPPAVAWIVGLLILIGLWAALFSRLMWVFRNAAWLEGTTLIVRGAFTTRTCDLAAAPHVALDSVAETTAVSTGQTTVVVPTGRRIPRLNATGIEGRTLRVELIDRRAKRWIDAWKLRLLADAILAGQRPEPQARQAYWVASGLRAMSNDPTGQIR